MDLGTRKRVAGLPPKRADVIVAGTVLYRVAMALWHIPRLSVSIRGVRHGTILKHLRENG